MTSPFETARMIGNNLGAAQQRSQDTSAIDQILQQASATGDPNAIDAAMSQILSRVSPERQQAALNILQQKKAAITGERDFQRQQQQKETEYTRSQQDTLQKQQFELEKIKAQQEGKDKKNPFEEQKQKRYAEIYGNAQEALMKVPESLSDLNRIRDLAEGLRGVKGYGKILAGSSDAAELDALGTTVIEPIIKVFNPVGAIPVAKINLIRDKHAPKATDRHEIILGKIAAIEKFTKNAQARAQRWIQLLDQYQGNPPSEALIAFTDEGEKMADAFEQDLIQAEQAGKIPEAFPSKASGSKRSLSSFGK